jgi:hypothetical protein
VTRLSEDEAVARVRTAVGAANGVAGRVWPVRRLDRPGEMYYLVVLGDDDASIAVGTVNVVTGDVGSSAHLPGRGPHLEVDAGRARTLAGAGEKAGAELVWQPSLVSKSPLYPVWEVALPSGPVYVDQAGCVRHDPP